MQQPRINVTPLIDVLLVLLIIFMVVSPMRPNSFKAKIPSEPTNDPECSSKPKGVDRQRSTKRHSLRLNQEQGLGSVASRKK